MVVASAHAINGWQRGQLMASLKPDFNEARPMKDPGSSGAREHRTSKATFTSVACDVSRPSRCDAVSSLVDVRCLKHNNHSLCNLSFNFPVYFVAHGGAWDSLWETMHPTAMTV